ncbi:hypothetical protein BGX23_002162 [Mortierella sp. AD031]|nr:hypothetical protein BGX23_002162 [Mortierella sp. AD031]
MLQSASTEDHVQAVRPVYKTGLVSVTPTSTAQTDVTTVPVHLDPSGKAIVFWDDIVKVFKHAQHARHKSKVVPFMKHKLRNIEPRQIGAIPFAVLDIVIDGPPAEVQGGLAKSTPRATTPAPPMLISTSTSDPVTSNDYNNYVANVPKNPISSRMPEWIPGGCIEILWHSLDEVRLGPFRNPQINPEDREVIMSHARGGDAASQVILGDIYKEGNGVEQDLQAAMNWYMRAAEQEYPKAQFRIAVLYGQGLGIAQDYAKAVEWCLRAAEQGDAIAQFNIAGMLVVGHGIAKDYIKATEWYLQSAEQEYAPAQYNVGLMFQYGNGVSQDYSAALDWYQKAAEQGHAGAQCSIGVFYDQGLGVQQNFPIALEWFDKSAAQDDPSTQYNLSLLYALGHGVSQNYLTAKNWCFKAAEQGHVEAQYRLGVIYDQAQGVLRDPSKALKWYLKAAEQGHEQAQSRAASLQEQGYVV